MNVFIVFGNKDFKMQQEVSNLLKSVGVNAKILQDYPSNCQTIIEKLESINDCNHALFLYSPLDKTYGRNGKEMYRARQNVVFESGFFMAKFGRQNVAFVMKKDSNKSLEEPSDVNGVLKIYKEKNQKWKIELLKQVERWFSINCANEILQVRYERYMVKLQNSLLMKRFDKQDVSRILHSSSKKTKEVIDAMLQLKLIQQISKSKFELI